MSQHRFHNFTAVLSCYSGRYHPLRMVPLGTTGGFSGAVIVRVETELGDYCLRGWPVKSLPRNRILGLHRFLSSVFQQGVTQAAVPVSAESGSTLVVVQDRFWQLEPWMPGAADFHDNPSDVRLAETMACLARWHRAASLFSPQPEEREWFFCKSNAHSPAVIERLEMIREWTEGKSLLLKQAMSRSGDPLFREVAEEIVQRFDRLAPSLTRQMEAAVRVPFELQPCLRDIWHDHVLFSGDEVTGLIDASACRGENVAADLSRLLGSFVGDDRSRWDFALEEYARHRPLSVDEEGLVVVLDRSGVLLSGMTWLDRYFLQRERFGNEPAILERLETIFKRLEFLETRR
ncbi:MAG: phosphotransferase [Planctomycetes bacterium]|nr:phosphotransferase [Planctomycetota bacterium]